jgi:hypothetical protein
MGGIGALRAALGIADPSVPALVFSEPQYGHAAQIESQYQQHSLFHFPSPVEPAVAQPDEFSDFSTKQGA